MDTLKLDSIHHKIEEMEKSGKLLQIAIVGGVKAGKSSILNALIFDGKSILPKAATPMTASLTTLSYGEELEVNIEYFTKEDLLNIKNIMENEKIIWQGNSSLISNLGSFMIVIILTLTVVGAIVGIPYIIWTYLVIKNKKVDNIGGVPIISREIIFDSFYSLNLGTHSTL